MNNSIVCVLITCFFVSCDNNKKIFHNSGRTEFQHIHWTDSPCSTKIATTTLTVSAVATGDAPDSTPLVGLRPLSDSIFVTDTTNNAIVKALYYTATGDSSLAGVSVADDYPEGFWMNVADTVLMDVMDHITYKQNNELVYFCILSGHVGNAQDHDFYVYTYVFLHLTPKGWWVKTEQPGSEMDLEDHELLYLKDGTLVFWRTTDCVIAGGDLWHHIVIDMVGKDTVLPVYCELDDWANTASDCKARSEGVGVCSCYSNHIDLDISHKKGQPFFIAKEILTETVFSDETCEAVGEHRTLNTKACMDDKCVLLSSKDLKTHKDKTHIKYNPKVIMDSLKVARQHE